MLVKAGGISVQVASEILDQIFEELERNTFSPQTLLHPLLFVCKEWNEIASRRLYQSISIGEGYFPASLVCQPLLRTVQGNSSLASSIRELRLGSPYHSLEDSFYHTQLLRVCKNVTHLGIYGYHQGYRDALNREVAGLDLIEFTLSRFTPQAYSGVLVPFCTPFEMMVYMSRWPRLRRIVVEDVPFSRVKNSFGGSNLQIIDGCCPFFHEIILNPVGTTFNPEQLRLLARMAPGVAALSIKIENNPEATEALEACLQHWSSSLIHLTITPFNNSFTDIPSLATACPNLRSLQSLTTLSTAIPPGNLVGMSELKIMTYFATAEHAEELLDALRDRSFVPSLRSLTVFFNLKVKRAARFQFENFAAETCDSIHSICVDRKISFKYGFEDVPANKR
ncbi:hypothetical protein SCHPADRAFT_203791 [Schizopora paradoxa]|uniref:F-box domain-containing protein n=1 Tax=Schizopora paradoxa TaxID=27342 RepID=A0A0H2S4D9_9AGAM|nr:hypothetical protein SCHPADRAFT_203791 [Schizopora paradoxa]